MGKPITSTPVGGNSDMFVPHFNEDGASFPQGTDATQYSGVFDLGEILSGGLVAVRVGDKPIAAGTGSVSVDILVGDDPNAEGTSTAWSTAATITSGTGTLAAGACLGKYIPTPGDAKKYWRAKATGVAGLEADALFVWNEQNPLAASRR